MNLYIGNNPAAVGEFVVPPIIPTALADDPHEQRAVFQMPIHDGRRERARHRVAADEHRIRVGRPRIGQHGLEGVDVPMDVVEDQDAHPRSVSQPAGCRSDESAASRPSQPA